MSWMQSIAQKLEKYRDFQADEKDPFVRQLTDYLRGESNLNYSDTVLERTVQDVLMLDEDLLAFVKKFILEQQMDADGLACGTYFTMEEFLENTGYNPVTAAIYFQMYRQDKAAALKAFLMQDFIEGEPKEED